MRVLCHPSVKVRLFEPLDTFGNCRDCATGDLSVKTVVKAFLEVGLDVLLVLHHLHVLVHLLVRGEDDGLALSIELRSTSATEDLLHVEHSHVFVGTS